MKRLLLMRHAKSSWSDPKLADHERPLAPRGRRDTKRMAKHLASLAGDLDLVVCSSAVRARETWSGLAERLPTRPEVRFEQALYLPSVAELLELLRTLPDAANTVLVVGHSPSLDALVLSLAAQDDAGLRARVAEKLPTAGLVELVSMGDSFAALGKQRTQLRSVTAPGDLAKSKRADASPQKARPIRLDERAHVAEAAAGAVESCIEQIRANTEGASLGADAEYIHQLRVGVRRLRVALRLFKKVLEPSFPPELADELRWVFQALGHVRDYDVFLRDIIEPLAREQRVRAVAPLKDLLKEERAQAVKRAREALRSERYAALLGKLLTAQAALSESRAETPALKRWARKRLDKRFERVLGLEDALAGEEPAARHALRKQLKKLRYSLEFVADVLPKKRRRYLERLSKVQGALGELNDVAVGERLLKQALRALPAGSDRRALAGRVRASLDGKAVRANLTLANTFPKLIDAKLPWR